MPLSSKFLFAFSLFNLAVQPASAAECTSKSGIQTVPLLELYTSEGCSSCPPAERWLSGLTPDPSKVVSLAFHVDYWDYIGWKDPFANTKFSDRQRKTAAFSGATYVYTPQFVMNGRDFRSADNPHLNQVISNSHKLASRAKLSLSAVIQTNGEIVLKASSQAVKPADIKNSNVFVAIYENKLVSQVKAGENNGRELKHDYVVREFFGAYPMYSPINNQNEFNKNFTLNQAWRNRDAGAVIFVQNNQTGEILQSLALKFCNS